ncbi:MAG: extracellular solute-binding protein [Verrucomicrobia bacterium]|nr:extracellular solute-binding protein [Verrucomicrobiota bacterium]
MRSSLRPLSLLVVLAIGAWLLWPPARPENGVAGKSASTAARSVKHVIRFAPGGIYFPGTLPQGVGEPLQGLTKVVAAFEARFPDTRVEFINTPVLREFLVTQLAGGSAPDIVTVNVEDVWVDTQKNWYVPLDRYLEAPNPFVAERDPRAPGARQWWDMFRYQAISRGKKGPDGRNYCISLDMVETGIFYNQTFFAAHGLKVPGTWGEFLTLAERIRRLGKTPLAVNIDALADWGQDLLFDQIYQEILPGIDLKKDPERDAYQPAYLDPDEIAFLYRKGLFTRRDPRYVEVWRHLHELVPYITRDLITADVVRDFVNQDAIMFWSGTWLTGRLDADKGVGFKWNVFYLPPLTRKESPYAIGVPMCVIGGSGTQFEITNSAVSDTDPSLPFAERIKRSERLRRTVQLLQFICLPENTEKIVNEFPILIPNIVGVPVLPQLAPFERILERRYTSTKWAYTFDLRFNDITRRMLLLFLTNGIDLDGFLAWQDSNLRAATQNFIERKRPDFGPFEREWRRRAPVRAHYRDLPTPP